MAVSFDFAVGVKVPALQQETPIIMDGKRTETLQ